MSRWMWMVVLAGWLAVQVGITFLGVATTPAVGYIAIAICAVSLLIMVVSKTVKKVWPLSLTFGLTAIAAVVGLYFPAG